MAMDSSDLFMLRRGLVEAGMKEDAAEKVAIAMEGAVALTIDQVLEKWTAKIEHDMEIVKKDMTIRLGTMIAGSVGVILAAIKWLI
jgi:hypothetical protein